MAGAYAKIESHEEICVLRHNTINSKLDDLKAGAKTQNRMAISILLALLAWMAGQVWGSTQNAIQHNRDRITTLESHAPTAP